MNASHVVELYDGGNVILPGSWMACFADDAMMADGDQGCKSADV